MANKKQGYNRNQYIQIAVSEDEKRKIENNAREQGLTVSSYLRKVGLENK